MEDLYRIIGPSVRVGYIFFPLNVTVFFLCYVFIMHNKFLPFRRLMPTKRLKCVSRCQRWVISSSTACSVWGLDTNLKSKTYIWVFFRCILKDVNPTLAQERGELSTGIYYNFFLFLLETCLYVYSIEKERGGKWVTGKKMTVVRLLGSGLRGKPHCHKRVHV